MLQEASWKSTPPTPSGNDVNSPTPIYIHELVTEKRRARNRWQRSRNAIDKREYNTLARRLKVVLQDVRNATFESCITSLSTDDHSIWKATKLLKRPTVHTPPLLQEDGNWGVTDKEKAAAFAAHLSNVFTTPQANNN